MYQQEIYQIVGHVNCHDIYWSSICSVRNISSYAYHILFYFSGNKRENKLKTRARIKYISTIISHILFRATNFSSKYLATWYTYLNMLPLIWHYKNITVMLNLGDVVLWNWDHCCYVTICYVMLCDNLFCHVMCRIFLNSVLFGLLTI
jgi:hypothetical protein